MTISNSALNETAKNPKKITNFFILFQIKTDKSSCQHLIRKSLVAIKELMYKSNYIVSVKRGGDVRVRTVSISTFSSQQRESPQRFPSIVHGGEATTTRQICSTHVTLVNTFSSSVKHDYIHSNTEIWWVIDIACCSAVM